MAGKSRISRSKWPWGRVSPTQRVHDLEVMIARSLAQIPIIEDQAREAIRRINLNVKHLEDQLGVARECELEAMRLKNKELAYELAMMGDDRIREVDEADDQPALKAKLERAIEEMKKREEELKSIEDDMDGFFT